eukprot:TRINITY_DN10006_c0_g1_i1.p1 TRINITY_DN10006_c0_g1~~TRINITY_DN10006_c0_g1_i1.p1  ORF type:complete len:237 (+),score=65.22 TRINITY_DN10006_c0_g1_i1:46-756(+)
MKKFLFLFCFTLSVYCVSETCKYNPQHIDSNYNYMDEQTGCMMEALKNSKDQPIDATCTPSPNVKDLCRSSGGSFCPYVITQTLPSRVLKFTLEVCHPNQCTTSDLEQITQQLNQHYYTILGCSSNCQFKYNCDGITPQTDSGPGMSMIVFILVLIALLFIVAGGLSFYVYKKKQDNPEMSVGEVLRDMPPMRFARNRFNKTKDDLSERFLPDSVGGGGGGEEKESKPYKGDDFYS